MLDLILENFKDDLFRDRVFALHEIVKLFVRRDRALLALDVLGKKLFVQDLPGRRNRSFFPSKRFRSKKRFAAELKHALTICLRGEALLPRVPCLRR